MLVDAQPRRLAVGDQADAVETGVPHVLDDLIGRARQHVTPIAGEFDGRGEERRSLLDRWGKLRHDCQRSVGACRARPASAQGCACCGGDRSDERAPSHLSHRFRNLIALEHGGTLRCARVWRTGSVASLVLMSSGRFVVDDRLDLVELLADLALGDLHIVAVLEIHPELCGGAEDLAETQRRIGGDPGRFRRDALDAGAGQITSLGKRPSGQIERRQEILLAELRRGAWERAFLAIFVIPTCGHSKLVVVGDLYVFRPFLGPGEAHAELIVDPD